MLSQGEVVELYAKEMLDKGLDVGDPKVEIPQEEWDSLYSLYLKGVEDGKKEE